MNDTRKQITAIIEPYTEKSLSGGCWINLGGYNYKKIYKRLSTNIFLLNDDNDVSRFNLINCPYTKIGHYDITAVLKYIEDNYKTPTEEKIIISNISFHIIGMNYEIPNKPLHLYTEKEEEKLLTLLYKLDNKGERY